MLLFNPYRQQTYVHNIFYQTNQWFSLLSSLLFLVFFSFYFFPFLVKDSKKYSLTCYCYSRFWTVLDIQLFKVMYYNFFFFFVNLDNSVYYLFPFARVAAVFNDRDDFHSPSSSLYLKLLYSVFFDIVRVSDHLFMTIII